MLYKTFWCKVISGVQAWKRNPGKLVSIWEGRKLGSKVQSIWNSSASVLFLAVPHLQLNAE